MGQVDSMLDKAPEEKILAFACNWCRHKPACHEQHFARAGALGHLGDRAVGRARPGQGGNASEKRKVRLIIRDKPKPN